MKKSVGLVLALVASSGMAQSPPPAPPAPVKAEVARALPETVIPQKRTTRLSGTFGGQRVNYAATIGETIIKGEDGTPKAAIVTTSYVREPRDSTRPVTFLFNGGPGSGSVWLQMGAFGPKRVAIPSNGTDDGAPPYPILDNPDSLLDVTDLVFIDPPGTGFSRLIGKTEGKEFYGVTADAKAVAEVIRRWLGDNGRWNSPKYVGGESYGTSRSAAVVNQLANATYNDVALNGVILISTILDFGAGADRAGNELSFITTLPSMAAAAHFHGKASGVALEPFLDEARAWAIGPYATALLKGQKLPTEERAAIRRQLSRFTGLTEAYLDQVDLRVSPDRFYKQLLRDRSLSIGRLDARYTGKDYDSAGENYDNDPSFYGIDAGYTAAINAWSRGTLGFVTDREYQSISILLREWDWRIEGGRDESVYLNLTPYLGTALRENSGLKIFVAQGYYDFATPFFAAEYALSRSGVPQERVEYHYYQSGHMMYVRDSDRTKLTADIRAFIRRR